MVWSRYRRLRGEQPVPSWPADEREPSVRVVIEHPDPAVQQVLADRLREAGHEVLTCGGPRAHGFTEISCPLLRREPCPAVSGADVVISCLQVVREDEGLIVRRIAGDPAGPRVLLEATDWQLATGLGSGVVDRHVYPISSASIVATVTELVGDR